MSKNICVVVLGDIGRSPRMQYHSESLAEHGHKVDIVGYRGAAPHHSLCAQPFVSFHYLNNAPNIFPRFLNYLFKALFQFFNLLFVFAIIRRPDFILVQNPPAVPTLIVCYLYKLCSGAKLIIDWHNYAYTIMGLNVGPTHLLVRITKWVEKFFGQFADYNFCVSNAMKNDLEGSWGIQAITLYDRSPNRFKSISIDAKHELFVRLQIQYKELEGGAVNETAFTMELDDKSIVPLDHPSGLLVSSTSWTEDEDFHVLINALQEYENHWLSGNQKKLPKLICVITGTGPLKQFYKKLITDAHWKHVVVIMPWLENTDYPKMLASADLGVSLHTSSSGLDLPMKVVDMFGCALPVCAYNFNCLHELVKHEQNGFIFNTPDELADQIMCWFENYPSNASQKLPLFRENLEAFQDLRWTENWNRIAAPLFK